MNEKRNLISQYDGLRLMLQSPKSGKIFHGA